MGFEHQMGNKDVTLIDPELDFHKQSDKLIICDHGYGIKMNPLNELDKKFYLVQGKHKMSKEFGKSKFAFTLLNERGVCSVVGIS